MSQGIVPIFLGVLLLSCPFSDLGGDGTQSDGGGAAGPGANEEATAQTGGDAASQLLPLCLGFQEDEWRDMCGAVFRKDISACEGFVREGHAELCGAYVASVSKDPSICGQVNPYVRGMDHEGNLIQTASPSDCYDYVASFMADKSLCEKAGSPSGCEYRAKIWADGWSMEECAESECLFAYAWEHNSTKACDQFAKLFPSDPLESAIRCRAMVTGYKTECNALQGGSVDVIYNCHSLSFYQEAMPSPGQFYPEKCEGFIDCERDVLTYMVRWASTHSAI
ncbi:MAG: hypothetical protein V1827_01925 [Candidatus Micrarchaeota archaeon]